MPAARPRSKLWKPKGTRDVGQAIELAKRHLDAGAQLIMIESEGITEQVASGAPTSSPASSPSSGWST